MYLFKIVYFSYCFKFGFQIEITLFHSDLG